MDGLLIVLQLLVVLAAIVLGVRMGGMGLGIWGAVGVAVLVFVFRLAPGVTPVNAILIILAVITAAAVMQAAGGIDYLVTVAARIIRANPRQVTLIAPLVSFAFVVWAFSISMPSQEISAFCLSLAFKGVMARGRLPWQYNSFIATARKECS